MMLQKCVVFFCNNTHYSFSNARYSRVAGNNGGFNEVSYHRYLAGAAAGFAAGAVGCC